MTDRLELAVNQEGKDANEMQAKQAGCQLQVGWLKRFNEHNDGVVQGIMLILERSEGHESF